MRSDTQSTSTETLLRVVADPKRRAILHHLRTADDGAVAVEELTEVCTSSGRTSDRRERESRTSIELYHTHLPTLADANLIAYDRPCDTVAYRGDDRAEALLAFVSERLD